MKTIYRTALPALAAVALVAFASHGGSNQKMGSLQQQVQGTWTMVSNVLDQGGLWARGQQNSQESRFIAR